MASGHVNRTQRPNTWLHRPTLRREDFPCQLGAVHTWPGGRVTSAAVAECRKWLTADLESRGADDVTKGERRKFALENFDVSARVFNNQVWSEAIAASGVKRASSRGRKKKRVG